VRGRAGVDRGTTVSGSGLVHSMASGLSRRIGRQQGKPKGAEGNVSGQNYRTYPNTAVGATDTSVVYNFSIRTLSRSFANDRMSNASNFPIKSVGTW
jgi:hypothetical protein